MDFTTRAIRIKFNAEEEKTLKDAKKIVGDLVISMAHYGTDFIKWSDCYGIAGEMSLDDLDTLYNYLDHFMNADEIY